MHILLFSRDPSLRHGLVQMLRELGHVGAPLGGAAAVVAELKARPTGTLVVDLAGGTEALRVVRTVNAEKVSVPVVVVADSHRPQASAEALRLGAIDVLARPVREADLLAAMDNAREYAAIGTYPAPPESLPDDNGLLAYSAAMRGVLDSLRRLGPSRCPVLILGEHGTGKELVARAIHARGRFPSSPFLTLDCAYRAPADRVPGGPTAEFEQQLFEAVTRPVFEPRPPRSRSEGHGGAAHPAAPSATVYLRSVGELPAQIQGTLERLLIESEAAGVGPGTVPVRLLAGARPAILEAVERGHFRRELFERLSVVRLDLPPLRQRSQDVPLLATHFLKEACRAQGMVPKTFSRSARTLLAALPWRGNAAELRILSERLAALVPRGVVLQEDVLEHVRLDSPEWPAMPQGTLREAREQFERDFIASALERHRGRVGAAARELGVERTNLYRKVRQLGIRLQRPGAPRPLDPED